MIDSRMCWKSILGLAFLSLTAQGTSAADRKLTVRGGDNALGETPVIVEIKGNLPAGSYRLVPNSGESIPALVYADQGKTYLGATLPSVKKGSSQDFRIEAAGKEDNPEAGVQFHVAPQTIDVTIKGKPFTTYRTDIGPKPIFYPVFGPTGLPITRAYPMKVVAGEDTDHPHHRSFWFTHGSVNGIDFWSEAKGHGVIKETARTTVVAGAALGLIRTTDDWLAPDGHIVCSDERAIRFYDTRHGTTMDVDVTIKATQGPVTFGDTKEGMFGLRIASSMDAKAPKTGKITNAEGLTNDEAWGKASPWVDYVGPVDGKTVGVAILNHPDSFRYPTTWHVRTYGLFAANPFGYHDFGRKDPGAHVIHSGESIAFRYRVVFHEGDTSSAMVPNLFRSYTEAPEVSVQGD